MCGLFADPYASPRQFLRDIEVTLYYMKCAKSSQYGVESGNITQSVTNISCLSQDVANLVYCITARGGQADRQRNEERQFAPCPLDTLVLLSDEIDRSTVMHGCVRVRCTRGSTLARLFPIRDCFGRRAALRKVICGHLRLGLDQIGRFVA
jgi:hypothetical protein